MSTTDDTLSDLLKTLPKSVQTAITVCGHARKLIDADEEAGIIHAAAYLSSQHGTKQLRNVRIDRAGAETIVRAYLQAILDVDLFEPAALLMWGPQAFDWRPESCRRVWGGLFEHDKLLVQGAGSMGKSYGAAAWFYLDWWRDPRWTCIKVVSLTRDHAERNIFASIKQFHRTALVRPVSEVPDDLATTIQVSNDSKQGIHLVAIPKGEDGHGTLRGFHPSPRAGGPHVRWGGVSRTHVILDEAEEISDGVWQGVQNILSAADTSTKGRIKVFAASNPRDRTSQFGQRCEPRHGWGSIDIEQDKEWVSRENWKVIRLDAADCENVRERRVIFHGLQTYEGFMAYVSRGRTAEASTMARGWFPDEGISMGVISPAMMDNAIGVVRFIGPVVPLASFDLALEGVDKVMCSYGRFGLADGWTARDGKFREFGKARTMLQLDSQIAFPKAKTLEQAQAIIKFCKTMKISPNWLCVDRTGNGAGIHDMLCSLFGEEVMGLNYSWAATDTPIMGDDSKKANELYNGLVTELLFALSKYLEFEWLKISPSFENEELVKQATGRRYTQKGKGLVRVEAKKDYVKRTRMSSPDALDSLSMLVHLMRVRGGNVATMTEKKPEPFVKPIESIVDSTAIYVDFS